MRVVLENFLIQFTRVTAVVEAAKGGRTTAQLDSLRATEQPHSHIVGHF